MSLKFTKGQTEAKRSLFGMQITRLCVDCRRTAKRGYEVEYWRCTQCGMPACRHTAGPEAERTKQGLCRCWPCRRKGV